MARTEENTLSMVLDHKDDGTSTMSVSWDYREHRVGIWVRYGPETSHKEAFSMMVEGQWKAMQSPLDYIVNQPKRGETTIVPYWDGLV